MHETVPPAAWLAHVCMLGVGASAIGTCIALKMCDGTVSHCMQIYQRRVEVKSSCSQRTVTLTPKLTHFLHCAGANPADHCSDHA